MSRKKTKKLKQSVESAAPVPAPIKGAGTAVAPNQYQIDLLEPQVFDYANASDWNAILDISKLPLEKFIAADRDEAAIWLARLYWVAVTEAGSHPIKYMDESTRAELHRRLQASADVLPEFFRNVEFEAYLDSFSHGIDDSLRLYRYLLGVCNQIVDIRWIVRLRDQARRLLVHLEHADAEDRNTQVPPANEILAALDTIYTSTDAKPDLSELARMRLTALRAELGRIVADPWDVSAIATSLRKLNSPSSEEVTTYLASHPSDGPSRQLPPVTLAFMWELAVTSYDGFLLLLERFPEDLGCALGNGLRAIVESLIQSEEHVDELLREGIRLLMQDRDASRPWLGSTLLVKTASGIQEVSVGEWELYVPKDVPELLLHLVEHAPERYIRGPELNALYRIYSAATYYAPLEDEDEAGLDMPGLDWVCQQSLSFQFAAAENIQGGAGRIYLVLDGIRRAVVEGQEPPFNYFCGSLTGEAMTEAEAAPVLRVIDYIVPVRDQMAEQVERVWLQVAPDVFRALSLVNGNIRKDVLQYARYCELDLLQKDGAFTLGYLEQVAGDPHKALFYYLYELDTAKQVNDAAIKNAKLLWAKLDDLEEVTSFVKTLSEAVASFSRHEVVRDLQASAKAKQDALNEKFQFERTAVNRWPSITAPARKLLGVLSNIQRYKGFKELAEYAGMQVEWAERHYNKLVDTGMLLISADGKYRINPHIKPMLDLESQHAVVGRIVRSIGTTAVKPVFNSQREFTIYQVMVQLCPNHLVFPNCSLQSIMSFERMKELVAEEDFGYYLRASVDIVVVSSSTYLPMLAIEVDSVWHDTERQQKNDDKKDRLFAAAGIPFMRLRPVGTPSENVIRGQVAEHLDGLIRSLRTDLPGYDQARVLLEDLSDVGASVSLR